MSLFEMASQGKVIRLRQFHGTSAILDVVVAQLGGCCTGLLDIQLCWIEGQKVMDYHRCVIRSQ